MTDIFDSLLEATRTNNLGSRTNEARPHTDQSRIPKEFIRMDPWEVKYLYHQAMKSTVGIQEIGRCFGGSTMVLAAANQSVAIRSIDIDPVNDELLADLFRSLQIGGNVCLQSGNSADFVPDYRYDLLFIDGDHRYHGVMKDLMSWWNNLVVGGSVIMHDSHHVDVADAIRDFTADQSVEFVLTAAGLDHALLEHGSLCHFRKL